MDDNNNFIYYLVLGAIYVLSKLFGKKKKQPTAVPRKKRNIAPPTSESEGPAPLSFEDILRELSGTKEPKPEPLPEPELPVFETVEKSTYQNDDIDEIAVEYKVPKPIVSEYKSTPAIVRKDLTFKRAANFAIEEKETIDFLEGLNDQHGAAKAFVMSEIFTRKYQ